MKWFTPVFLLFSLISLSLNVQAESTLLSEIQFITNASVSDKRMKLDIRDRDFQAKFVMGSMSLAVLHKDLFGSVEIEQSVKDDIGSDGNGLIFYSRSDYTLTLGKSFLKNFSAFAGYRAGTTNSHYSVSNDQFSISSHGLFAGGGYHINVQDLGSVRFTLAIANLNGEVSLFEPFADRSLIPNAPSTINGSAIGYSAGASWSGSFAHRTTYSLEYTLHRYEFKDQEVYGGIDLSFNENFNIFSIGLTRSF